MIEEELIRISNMSLQQLLLKVRNLKHYQGMNIEHHKLMVDMVNNKLREHNYKLDEVCCGRYVATKL